MAYPARCITLEEFLKLPEQKPALEYIDGVITQKVSPQGQHARLQAKTAQFLNDYAEPRRLALAFTELRTTYAGDSPVPDVAVYRWRRIPRTDTGKIANDFTQAPDLAIEILSPKQSIPQQIARSRRFARNGATIALLLNPDDETVRRLDADGATLLQGEDRIDLDVVLPGFQLTVRELFDTLRIE